MKNLTMTFVISLIAMVLLSAINGFAQVSMLKAISTTGVTATENLLVTYLNNTQMTAIFWGDNCIQNSSYTQPCNITNIGNIPLNLVMTNTISVAWLRLSWNLTANYLLAVHQSVIAVFTLTIGNAPQGAAFGFNINIAGTHS